MLQKLLSLLVVIWVIDICFSEVVNDTDASQAEVNVTRREILEKQARSAYHTACLRLQELSNWMTVLFKLKSVWAGGAVNQLSSKSDGLLYEAERRMMPTLPSRVKSPSSECSLRSVQVTAQTFAHLQSQMLLLKIIVGRNLLRAGKAKLDEAGIGKFIMERVKMLNIFNTTLNDIVDGLKKSTQEVAAVDSFSWRARNILQDIQQGRFLEYLPNPTTFLRTFLEDQNADNSDKTRKASRNFFQNLGKSLDRLFFSDNSHADKTTDNSHIDKTIDNSHIDKTTDNSHIDKATDKSHIDKATDKSHIDKTTDKPHINTIDNSHKKSDNFHKDKTSDNIHQDKTENSYKDKNLENSHINKKSDNSHINENAEKFHINKISDNPFIDKTGSVAEAEKITENLSRHLLLSNIF